MPLVCCIGQILKVFKRKETNTDGAYMRNKIGCVVDLTTRKQERSVKESEKLHIQPICCVNLGQVTTRRNSTIHQNIRGKIYKQLYNLKIKQMVDRVENSSLAFFLWRIISTNLSTAKYYETYYEKYYETVKQSGNFRQDRKNSPEVLTQGFKWWHRWLNIRPLRQF